MLRLVALTLLAAAACWAPDPLDHPNLSAPAAAPLAIPAPDEAEAPPVVSDGRPALAWTRAAPLTLVRAGGAPAVTLDRYGVRVNVLQQQAHRVRVRCEGCDPAHQAEDLWLQAGQLSAGPASGADPLSAALRLRAQWAAGEGPGGAGAADALCALLDAGFAWTTDEARFAWGGGSLLLQFEGAAWQIGELSPPSEAPAHRCAVAPSGGDRAPAAGAAAPESG
jgi:hypothetical protein